MGGEQVLIQELRRALRTGEPLEFLSLVSGLLEATDRRNRVPLGSQVERPTREDLVESFIGTSYAETTAALTAIRELIDDELLAARIGRELVSRRQPLPDWLRGLEAARVEDEVWF